jgi:hypothetical protein
MKAVMTKVAAEVVVKMTVVVHALSAASLAKNVTSQPINQQFCCIRGQG